MLKSTWHVDSGKPELDTKAVFFRFSSIQTHYRGTVAQHSTIQAGLTDIYAALYKNDSPAFTDEETKELARVRALGMFDPKVIAEGTLAYAMVLLSGFTAVLIGSSRPITPGVRALADKLGPADVLIVAYQP